MGTCHGRKKSLGEHGKGDGKGAARARVNPH